MPETNQARQKEVKVEDLLRLKRAERPDVAFWDNFDRELHQRMLQTLVKKDPWYVQVMRGLTGRIAQTVTVGAAAVFVAMLSLRPAMVDNADPKSGQNAPSSHGVPLADLADQSSITDTLETLQAQGVLPTFPEIDFSAVMDYKIDTISNEAADTDYTAEYALDSFEVATHGREAYVSDSASFALSGVATSLVY